MRIIPLGTSAGKPTLHRGVSATAVVGEGAWWLFDCGEATQMRVMRAGLSPQKLVGIFITHLHGDHFNGLPGLLSTMAMDGRTAPLALVGPAGIRHYLDTLAALRICYVNYPLQLTELTSEQLRATPEPVVWESATHRVATRSLDHRIFALGYRLEEKTKPGRFDLDAARALGIPPGPLYGQLQSGRAITLADGRTIDPSQVLGPPRPGKVVTYCLDTRPCESAVALAHNADWLIYEATFTHDLAEEARHYGHSTARQAAETARAAGARRLLLTHFSSRYQDVDVLLAEAREFFSESTLARDLMELEV